MSTNFLGLNLTNNYSFYAVPAAWAVCMVPHFYAMMLYNKERAPGTNEWDGSAPKQCIANIKDAKMSPYMQSRVLRAESANENGFQVLPIFTGAIIAANLAKIPPRTINTLVGLYLASRVAYTYIYINGTTKFMGNMRSVAYLTGIFTCFSLYIQAGNKLF